VGDRVLPVGAAHVAMGQKGEAVWA
jgi:hypothetical protein